MPIVKIENISEGVSLGLWKIEEKADDLLKRSFLSPSEKKELDSISNIKKRKEWLGARALLKAMVDERGLKYSGLIKDEYKKPFLVNQPNHISISHCFPYAAVLIHDNSPCGIDIEEPKPALFHIANKFLSEKEQEFIARNPKNLCLAWAAKEALYKIHGRKRLSFKESMELSPFNINEGGDLQAKVVYENMERFFTLNFQCLDNHVMCYNY